MRPHYPPRLALCALAATGAASASILPDQVLVLWNSASAESQAIRDAYAATRPGVRDLNLNDPTIVGTPARIPRSVYLASIRAPLLAYLGQAGPGGQPLARSIVAIVTTRGVPAQIQGVSEFDVSSSWSSVESELALVQQDLEAAGVNNLPNRFYGAVANPYSAQIGAGAETFPRTNIQTQRPFLYASPGAWIISGLTPGDIYLVTRLDAAPTAGATAVQNTIALIQRSADLWFDPCQTRASLDRWACTPLDDDSLGAAFPPRNDFPNAAAALAARFTPTTLDQTGVFLSQATLPPGGPMIAVGTYGTNHSLQGCGDAPPGGGGYVSTGFVYHPACVFVAYESWCGNSMIDGTARGGQGQVLDFISAGGSFTIGSVTEPFTFSVPRVELLARNLLLGGMTFAEAAYSALPALSWQWTPIGDPLATVRVSPNRCPGDATGDGAVNFADLSAVLGSFTLTGACLPADLNRDGVVNFLDLSLVLANYASPCR